MLAQPRARAVWFSSYIQTYLERDLRAVTNVRDLASFRRFLALVASRHGQMLNRTDIAAPLGISVPTVNEWLRVREVTGQAIIVPPYFENFGKRLIRAPKVYAGDSGLACFRVGNRLTDRVGEAAILGPIFEGYVAAEILKSQMNRGGRRLVDGGVQGGGPGVWHRAGRRWRNLRKWKRERIG